MSPGAAQKTLNNSGALAGAGLLDSSSSPVKEVTATSGQHHNRRT